MANSCKYYKQQRQVSYDNGVTWIDLQEFRKGALYEPNSSDCTNPSIKIYRWQRADTSDYVCVGDDKHYKEYYQESSDNGQTWSNVVPTQTRASSQVIEYDSSACRSRQYLTFIALEDGTFSFEAFDDLDNKPQYSLDSGITWTTLASGTSTPTVSIGQKIMWKGTMRPLPYGTSSAVHGIGGFSATNNFEVEGNVMSLLYGDDFEGETSLSGIEVAFANLFSGKDKLISAENMVLPATTLSKACYSYMFQRCYNLTTPPKILPATTLADQCYLMMFDDCTSLTSLPELPATTMEKACYYQMFSNCTSLTSIPSNYLSATTVANQCYYGMFFNCSGLTTTPSVLPATTLAESCYESMFSRCTSLTTLPSGFLPATTLAKRCYSYMFSMDTISSAEASLLTTVPSDLLPATTVVNYCYSHMFYGCRRLTNAPELLATNTANACYWEMFYGCSSLTTAPSVLPAITLANQCYDNMFYGCSSLTTAPTISATSFVSNALSCCESMFFGCSSLMNVQSVLLPTSLKQAVYRNMFFNCRSLTAAPELPATTLASSCYDHMFYGCRNLNYIKCLATDISAEDCTTFWVGNVASSGTFVKNSNMSSWTTGTSGIPNNWTVQNA